MTKEGVVRVSPRIQTGWWLAASAIVFIVLGPTTLTEGRAPEMLLTAGLIAVLEAFHVRLPRSPSDEAVTINDAGVALGILLLAPPMLMVSVAAGLAIAQAWRRRSWVQSLFNIGQQTVAAGLAAASYQGVAADAALLSTRSLGAVVVAMLIWSVVNWTATAAVISAASEQPMGPLLLHDAADLSRATIAGFSVGLLGAYLWADNPTALLLLAIPLVSIYVAHRMLVERDRLLTAVEAERDLLDTAIRDTTDGIALRDGRGVIELWSPAMARLTGIPANEAVGSVFADLPLFADAPVPEPGQQDRYEITVATRPHPRHLQVSHRQRGGSGARPEGDVVTVSDVTGRVEADRLKDDFLSRVSHELRTPLTAITGFADALHHQHGKLDDARQREFVGRIRDRAAHMRRLVDDLLFVGSSRDAIRPGASRSVDLNELVQALIRDIDDPTHRFEMDPAADASVDTDPGAVERILGSLLDNAIQYSPAGTTIRISLTRRDAAIDIAVSDEGPGIPSSQHELIFDRFYRAEDPLTMQTPGTGLGLFIARRLAETIGGTLDVRSQPERGATFTLTLPAPGRSDDRPAGAGSRHRRR